MGLVRPVWRDYSGVFRPVMDDTLRISSARAAISNQSMDLADVRNPSGHIFEGIVEHLVVRHQTDADWLFVKAFTFSAARGC